MRLENYEVVAIKDSVKKMDENAKIYLFGSRVDNSKKGGDIDILIFSQKLKKVDALEIKGYIYDKIGEQKIDILIVKDKSDPFTRIALKESIEL